MRKALLFLAVCACCGCTVFRHKDKDPPYSEPVVFGERVMILKAGDIIEIEEPKPPAKTWYLVDDVGLSFWLGIPYNHIPNGKSAYDEAMDGLDAAEDLGKDLGEKLTGCQENSEE